MYLFWLICWFGCGAIAASIGGKKTCGKKRGFWFGFLLGIIGIIIVSLYNNIEPETEIDTNKNAEELLKWNSLREKGVISEEEFLQKKKDLL